MGIACKAEVDLQTLRESSYYRLDTGLKMQCEADVSEAVPGRGRGPGGHALVLKCLVDHHAQLAGPCQTEVCLKNELGIPGVSCKNEILASYWLLLPCCKGALLPLVHGSWLSRFLLWPMAGGSPSDAWIFPGAGFVSCPHGPLDVPQERSSHRALRWPSEHPLQQLHEGRSAPENGAVVGASGQCLTSAGSQITDTQCQALVSVVAVGGGPRWGSLMTRRPAGDNQQAHAGQSHEASLKSLSALHVKVCLSP